MSISRPAFDVLDVINKEAELQLSHTKKSMQTSAEAFRLMLRASEKNAAGSIIQDQQIKFQTKVIEGTRDIQF
jgi:hypothetical protein